MIKINLLAVDRDRTKRKPKFQIGNQVTLGCTLVVITAVLGVGWWFWSLRNESAQLDRDITSARAETQRLRSVIQQVQQFEDRRAQLQQRVSLIEELRKGQTGPVQLLDQISRSLPDSMWLTEMRQVGPDVFIDGRCTSLTALSDFIAGLTATKLFAPPVEIVDSRVEPATAKTPELIKFTVKARLVGPAS